MKRFVIMADVIDSSTYEGKPLMNDFKAIVNEINKSQTDAIDSPLTITLGDEFQGIAKDLNAAVKVMFLIDEALLQADTAFKLRYVINYGEVDTPINKEKAYEMLGEGLTKARKQLEQLKQESKELQVLGIDEAKQQKLNLALQLYRSLYNDWHTKDLKLAHDFIQNDDYKALAKTYDRDPSSMWRKRKSLKIEDFNASKELVKLICDE